MGDVIVITGPTASGKTSISIEIAKKINAEIINADSMQIYKHCDIGTAKPSPEELSAVSHHLIDIIEPDENFSAAQYKTHAEKAIRDILIRGKRAVITGGTGMYIDALVKNLDFSMDNGASDVRKIYTELLEKTSPSEIYDILRKRDPVAAESVHPNNTRRVIRYLEILENFEGNLEQYNQMTRMKPSEFNYKVVVLLPDRKVVYKRIEDRVDLMIDSGLVGEVKELLKNGINGKMQSMQGIGYKETIQYIEEILSFDEYVQLLKRNTRRYAKRQFTWMNRYKDALKVELNKEYNMAEIRAKIMDFIEI